MKLSLLCAAALSLTACGSVMPIGNNMLDERRMTTEEAVVHCKATAHSPLVYRGIDPNYIKIMPHTWTWEGKRKMGEYFSRSTMIWTINHKEPLYHESIHRGLALVGEDFNNHSGTFRDEEHQLIYHVLDRDFPGLQAHRIAPQKRRWAKERWTRPEYQARLSAVEQRAREADSWCKRNAG